MAGDKYSYQRASRRNRDLIDKARLNVSQTAMQFATAESIPVNRAKGLLAEARRIENYRQPKNRDHLKLTMLNEYKRERTTLSALCEKYDVSLTWFNRHVRSQVTRSIDGHTEPRMDPYGLLRRPMSEWGDIVLEARA